MTGISYCSSSVVQTLPFRSSSKEEKEEDTSVLDSSEEGKESSHLSELYTEEIVETLSFSPSSCIISEIVSSNVFLSKSI